MRRRRKSRSLTGVPCSATTSGVVGAVVGALIGGVAGLAVAKVQQLDSVVPNIVVGMGIGAIGVGSISAVTANCPSDTNEPFIFDERGNMKPFPKNVKIRR